MSDSLNGITGLDNIYNNYTTKKTDSLENKLNSSDLSSATDDELMSVCKDFESYFVEQMLKSMEKMSKIDSDDDDNRSLFSSMAGITGTSDSGMSTLSSYFGGEMLSQLADSITESNGGKGLGLAQTLYEQMKRNYQTTQIDSDNSNQ
ncbi:MAG: hypothetical protein MR675_05810 [Lachnospira sp.]|nr:hypothetical protein [Lachnospira sp.]